MPATNPLTSMYCPKCDRLEQGRTTSRLLNTMNGYKCTGAGHHFPNYIQLMDMKPRMDKLQVREKQPQGSSAIPMWIHPDALVALQTRFPQNLQTTLYSLFNSLADPDTILLEGEHCRELRTLGIHKGREIVGLAKTNIALTEQLKQMADQMKQYEFVAKLIAATGGGGAIPAPAAGASLTEVLTGQPEIRPPQRPVIAPIDTDSDQLYYEDVAPGSFSDGTLAAHENILKLPAGMPKPVASGQ